MTHVNNIPVLMNTDIGKEGYEKIAFQKYLDGDIGTATLYSLLVTL